MSVPTFIAYAGGLPLVREAIKNAVVHLRDTASKLVSPTTWEEMDIPGRFIATEVLTNIDSSEFTIADISKSNFNVFYEIGYSIGRGKRVLLIRHSSVTADEIPAHELGLFDTLGWKPYSNGSELAQHVKDFDHSRKLSVSEKPNLQSPIYTVQPKHKTDYDGYILSAIVLTQ